VALPLPQTLLRELTVLPRPLLDLRGRTSKGRKRKGRGGREERKCRVPPPTFEQFD